MVIKKVLTYALVFLLRWTDYFYWYVGYLPSNQFPTFKSEMGMKMLHAPLIACKSNLLSYAHDQDQTKTPEKGQEFDVIAIVQVNLSKKLKVKVL